MHALHMNVYYHVKNLYSRFTSLDALSLCLFVGVGVSVRVFMLAMQCSGKVK